MARYRSPLKGFYRTLRTQSCRAVICIDFDEKTMLIGLLFTPEDALQTAHKTALERKRNGEKLKRSRFRP